ncbi:hypothetical protein VTO42DRAFT_2729 [Malbranchea cinnamomea]
MASLRSLSHEFRDFLHVFILRFNSIEGWWWGEFKDFQMEASRKREESLRLKPGTLSLELGPGYIFLLIFLNQEEKVVCLN